MTTTGTTGTGGDETAAARTTAADIAWSPLTGLPPELITLSERCLQADGGMPLATDPAFLHRRWAARGVVAFALRDDDGELLAAGAARATPGGATFTGLVDPSVRGRGLGTALLDRGLAEAGTLAGTAPAAGRHAEPVDGSGTPITITVESETLTDEADALFVARGLRRSFAEDVLRIDLDETPLPPPSWPADATVIPWSSAVARRFHTTYEAAFRDRPGFPGDPAGEWIAENEDDEDFRPGCSLLVTVPGVGDAGFVTAAQDWIVQIGVVPPARRRGLAGALLVEALTRLRADGSRQAWLTVNVNNPGAAALYRRLGFADHGHRARYQR